MSTRYLFKSISIKNFRSFECLDVDSFKRINIIGGFNGAGKSSLLETLFLILDTQNTAAIAKPYAWREVPIASSEDLSLIFKDRLSDANLKAETSIGIIDVNVTKASAPQHVLSTLTSNIQKAMPPMTSAPATDPNGLKISVRLNGQEKIISYSVFTMSGVGGVAEKIDPIPIPNSVIISKHVKSTVQDHAQRLSEVIRTGRQESLIEPLRLIQPDLESFTILHNVAGPAIYATINKNLIPVNLLGDGFITLFDVILAISQSRNGAVLLDEVDTSLHYSVTTAAWEIISKAANAENCQIFATSHSREGIVNAAEGIMKAGREKDFQYLRLERSSGQHKVISYNMTDLKAAEEFNFEFR